MTIDTAEAARYLKLSADQDYSRDFANRGLCRAIRFGFNVNLSKAVAYFCRAGK
jgi:hypothetical protein